MCDWIEKRADLDAAKIAMWGVSLGGYYAPRATAYEKRIKACIALSGPFEWKEIWGALPVLTREAFRVRSHCISEADALKNAATLSMKEAAAKIACPIFIVTGRQDRLVPASHAERLAKGVSGPVELLIVEDGGHNANNRAHRRRETAGELGSGGDRREQARRGWADWRRLCRARRTGRTCDQHLHLGVHRGAAPFPRTARSEGTDAGGDDRHGSDRAGRFDRQGLQDRGGARRRGQGEARRARRHYGRNRQLDAHEPRAFPNFRGNRRAAAADEGRAGCAH